MASLYPGSLDAFSTTHIDGVGEIIHAVDVNNLADAVNKIEAELGTLPKGIFSSVSAKLGALYYGAISTATRDAIAAGSRPAGMQIYNTTTGRLEWNSGSDAAPSWRPIAADNTGSLSLAGGFTVSPGAAVVSGYRYQPTSIISGQYVINSTLVSEAFGRFAIDANGVIIWGTGSSSTDTNLYRVGVGQLGTDSLFVSRNAVYSQPTGTTTGFVYNPSASGGFAFYSILQGAVNPKFTIADDGTMSWGTGGGVGATVDTIMRRSATGQLTLGSSTTPSGITFYSSTGPSAVFQSFITTDINARLTIYGNGDHYFGPGSTGPDAFLGRRQPNTIGIGQLASGTAILAIGSMSNYGFGGATGDAGIAITNAVNTPVTPVGGGILFVQAGALKWKGSGGTVTTIATA